MSDTIKWHRRSWTGSQYCDYASADDRFVIRRENKVHRDDMWPKWRLFDCGDFFDDSDEGACANLQEAKARASARVWLEALEKRDDGWTSVDDRLPTCYVDNSGPFSRGPCLGRSDDMLVITAQGFMTTAFLVRLKSGGHLWRGIADHGVVYAMRWWRRLPAPPPDCQCFSHEGLVVVP
jgi:hypothetical protein